MKWPLPFAMSGMAGLLLLASLFATRQVLEGRMLHHMLIQLPLLVVCGACLRAGFTAVHLLRRVARCDVHGLASFTAVTFIAAYWMLPRALEQALAEPSAEAAKFASLLLAGFVMPGALGRSHLMVQLFFVANACAMMAIAGLLYQDLPDRLCNAYLIDDQRSTGGAMVGLSIALAVAWGGTHWSRLCDASPS